MHEKFEPTRPIPSRVYTRLGLFSLRSNLNIYISQKVLYLQTKRRLCRAKCFWDSVDVNITLKVFLGTKQSFREPRNVSQRRNTRSKELENVQKRDRTCWHVPKNVYTPQNLFLLIKSFMRATRFRRKSTLWKIEKKCLRPSSDVWITKKKNEFRCSQIKIGGKRLECQKSVRKGNTRVKGIAKNRAHALAARMLCSRFGMVNSSRRFGCAAHTSSRAWCPIMEKDTPSRYRIQGSPIQPSPSS